VLHSLQKRKAALSKERGFRMNRNLERDRRLRHSGAASIEEEAHAKSFGALRGHQSHLTANMILILEVSDLCLVPVGVFLEASDAILDGLAKARADFKEFQFVGVVRHGRRPFLR
jgi:hypothetical protein